MAGLGDLLEAKRGIIDRIRRALGGSPSDHEHGHGGPSAAPSNQPLEMLRDTARDLCADSWLANQITIDLKTENGKTALVYHPAESRPYIKAAYAIRKDDLPAEMRGLFDAAS